MSLAKKYDPETYAEGTHVHLHNKQLSIAYIKDLLGKKLPDDEFGINYVTGNRDDATPSILVRLPASINPEIQNGVVNELSEKLQASVKNQFENHQLNHDKFISVIGFPTQFVQALRTTDSAVIKTIEQNIEAQKKLKISGAISQTLATASINNLTLNEQRNTII